MLEDIHEDLEQALATTKGLIASFGEFRELKMANPGKDMWINVSRTKPGKRARPSWAQLGSNSKTFAPVFRAYGPGDPRAMSERRMRFEGDLDGGVAGGAPGEIDVFFEV